MHIVSKKKNRFAQKAHWTCCRCLRQLCLWIDSIEWTKRRLHKDSQPQTAHIGFAARSIAAHPKNYMVDINNTTSTSTASVFNCLLHVCATVESDEIWMQRQRTKCYRDRRQAAYIIYCHINNGNWLATMNKFHIFFSSVQRKRLIDFDNRRRTALSHTLRPKCEAPFRKGQQKNINLCLYCIYHSMHSSIAFIRHRSRTSLVVSFFRFPRPPASTDLSRRRPTIFFSLVLSLSVFSFV